MHVFCGCSAVRPVSGTNLTIIKSLLPHPNMRPGFVFRGYFGSLRRTLSVVRNRVELTANSGESFDASEFVKWCRSAIQQVIEPISNLAGLTKHRNLEGLTTIILTQSEEHTGEETQLKAYLAPFGKMFPSMLDDFKQTHALAKSVAVQRIQPIDKIRFNYTVDSLKRGEAVAWIGHSGVGKSTEQNILLIQFIMHLGEEGWPAQLAHRIGRVIYEYTYVTETKKVECTIIPAPNLAAVDQYCAEKKRLAIAKRFVLFLELDEDELDPKVSGLSTFIAVSSRDIWNTLKTLNKSQALTSYLVRPHTPTEVRMLARLIYLEDRANLITNLGLHSDSSEEDAIAAIDQRVALVGPLPRVVFERKNCYEQYLGELESTASKFLNGMLLNDMSYNSIPSHFMKFVAPHPVVRTDGSLARGHADFQFLSAHAAALVAAKTDMPEQVLALIKYGFAYQVVEGVVQCALIKLPSGQTLHEGAQREQWEWHSDPGPGKTLALDTMITDAGKIPLHPLCDTVARFTGNTFRRSASDLSPGVLYVSTTHNFKVGEFFSYDAGDESKGVSPSVNFYQASTVSMTDHPFAVSALLSVFESMQLFEQNHMNITMNIICIVDSSQQADKIKGCKFTATQKDLDAAAAAAAAAAKAKEEKATAGALMNAAKPKKGKKSAVQGGEMQPQQVEHNVIDATATDDNTTTETKDKVVRNMDLKRLMRAFPQFKGRVFTFFARADVYKFSRFVVTKRSARTSAAKPQVK